MEVISKRVFCLMALGAIGCLTSTASGIAQQFPGQMTAFPSRVIWGQPVTLSAKPQSPAVDGQVTFYNSCDQKTWTALGTGKVVNGLAELQTTADKLHLGSNDLAFAFFRDPTGISVIDCSPEVVTVL